MIRPDGDVNIFGRNFPVEDSEALASALGIASTDRVLDVGGAANAFARADVVCDLTFASCDQRNGAPGVFREDVTYVEAPVEALPFADKEFDFVLCSQVLEHVRDPAQACRELARVARRGLIETPSRTGEMWFGNPTHRWIVDLASDGLVFSPRGFVEHPFENVGYGIIFGQESLRRKTERTFRNVFNLQWLFEGDLPCEVKVRGAGDFDYDDPTQAGRAHYDFARNVLRHGADPDYAYGDALAARLHLPHRESPRLLLAIYQMRMLRTADARVTLQGPPTDRTAALLRLLDRLENGEPLDLRRLPIPPVLGIAEAGEVILSPRRPRVSFLVLGGPDPTETRRSVEAALAQDYSELEVLVAASEGAVEELRRFRMGHRLHIVPCRADASLEERLRCLAPQVSGEILAFAVAGDRPFPHHLDRMVSRLEAGDDDVVYGDRVHLNSGGLVGPDWEPRNPAVAGASLSTMVARRGVLEPIGFPIGGGTEGEIRYLLRLAQELSPTHIHEATVESVRDMPHGAVVLDVAEHSARLRPLELFRSLIAAHEREAGLRRRIQQLEGQGRGSGEALP